MEWMIKYHKEAIKDLRKIDPYSQKLILKAIEKTAESPLPPPKGKGKPLGNHNGSALSSCCKIKLRGLGYRVVYKPFEKDGILYIIVISIREDGAVYKEAERRLRKLVSYTD